MKKIVLSMVMMFTAMVGANAQYNVSGHKFFDNWSLGTDGGVSTNFHDWNTPWGGVWGIQLTKGVTPVVSFEFSAQMGFNDNNNWEMMDSKNAVDNVTAMASTKINLMNWFCGYKGTPRLFEIQARAGIGYMRSFYPEADLNTHYNGDVNTGVAKLGFDFDFNLGKAKAWTISLRPAIVFMAQNGNDASMGCEYADDVCKRYTHNAVGQLTAGVTYHFKGSNGAHHFTNIEPVEVTKVVEKIVEKPVEKIVEKEKVVEKPVEKLIASNAKTYMVNFAMGKSDLDAAAKKILDGVDGKKAAVIAFASPEGNAEKNQELSQKRADAVAEYLKAKGIKVETAKGGGVTGPNSGRLAIITAE